MRTTLASKHKTILISRNKLFREGLNSLLEGTKYEVCAVAGDVDELRELTAEESKGAVALVDGGGGRADTTSAVRRLRDERPEVAVIVLSDRPQPRFMADCLSVDASGYLLTDICFEALLQSLELVTLGEKVFPTQLATIFTSETGYAEGNGGERADAEKLSERERQILRCLVKGASNKVIARRLDIADATVKVHMKGLLKKIKVENRTQAAVWALNHGFEAAADVTPGTGVRPTEGIEPSREVAT